MRHKPEAIRNFLTDQSLSGQSIISFCKAHDLKVSTFYSWKRKYGLAQSPLLEGFCKITPKQETVDRRLRLPSGLGIELLGFSIGEIAELVLEIDRAYV